MHDFIFDVMFDVRLYRGCFVMFFSNKKSITPKESERFDRLIPQDFGELKFELFQTLFSRKSCGASCARTQSRILVFVAISWIAV